MQPLGPPSWAAPTNAAIVVVATAQGAQDMVEFGNVWGRVGSYSSQVSCKGTGSEYDIIHNRDVEKKKPEDGVFEREKSQARRKK
jgi:hypothetical protein